jgi:hypothetical protein
VAGSWGVPPVQTATFARGVNPDPAMASQLSTAQFSTGAPGGDPSGDPAWLVDSAFTAATPGGPRAAVLHGGDAWMA